MEKILITGCLGQIGSELTQKLRQMYGSDNIIATDIREPEDAHFKESGIFEILDVTDAGKLEQLIERYEVDTLIHLAALLSAVAEEKPLLAWNLNMNGLLNTLEAARKYNLEYFTPSSIGAFGPDTPKAQTPQMTIQRPTTMYGVTKVSGELLADYYHQKYGVDTRSMRFPGLISYDTLPGGGTTDYAVEIYYEALKNSTYTSFIDKGTYMDMMYMPDAIEAIIQLMEADGSKLKNRNAYNVSSMSICPEDIERSIQSVLPEFTLSYQPDPVRQNIAESWPDAIATSCATEEWGFNPKYKLDAMTRDMLEKLSHKVLV